MKLAPITIKEAARFIKAHHRHHRPPQGGLFAVGVERDGVLVGVAVVGRPVARKADDGRTAEVTRLATDGTRNACSMLYGACWRAARALGYQRLITYTLKTETGDSLRGAGWTLVGEAGGGSWSRPSRPREDKHPTQSKLRWEVACALLACVLAASPARAYEVPPVIVGVREAVRDARRVLEDKPAPAQVAPVVGECRALPEVEDVDVDQVAADRHLRSCSRAGRRSDPWMVLTLVRLERELGAPDGLLSAVACWETGYTQHARGDWRDGVARAHGPMQLHPVWYRACGLSAGARDDVEASARCYLSRVYAHAETWSHCDRPLVVGEAMAANSPKYTHWGCDARSMHALELERWGR